MSETPQQDYDCIRTLTRKVGGGDARSTFIRLFEDIRDLMRQVGPDGIVMVTVSAHVPSRRLPSATSNTAG